MKITSLNCCLQGFNILILHISCLIEDTDMKSKTHSLSANEMQHLFFQLI